jgi:hypothetical protein
MSTPLRLLAGALLASACLSPAALAALKTAVADGNWTASATWSPAGAPVAGDDVVIPAGRLVTYDSTSTAALNTVKIRGTLKFRTTGNTNLTVGVLTVGPDTLPGSPDTGTLIVGEPGAPIPRPHTATIRLAALSGQTVADHPALFCNGGRWVMQGATLANPWTRLTANANAGATSITVADSINDWAVGDEVLVVASRNSKSNFADDPPSYRNSMTPESETRTITAINTSTRTITLNSGLTYSHQSHGGYFPEVANLTRTVVVTSADRSSSDKRGHTMFNAHSRGSLAFARFDGLGKEGVLGRYPVHVHMAGKTARGLMIEGCSVTDSHNKFYVVHRTHHVVLRNNVGFRGFTSGFFLEDGTETYTHFDRNLSVLTITGANAPNEALSYLNGEGFGFWWANGRNAFTRNVAAESDRFGFFYDVRKVTRYYSTVYSSATTLSVPMLREDGGETNTVLRDIRIFRFDDNIAHAQKTWAYMFRGGLWTNSAPSRIRNNVSWSSHYPISVKSDGMLVEGFVSRNSNYGVDIMSNYDAGNNQASHITFTNLSLQGATTNGFDLEPAGANVNFLGATLTQVTAGWNFPNFSWDVEPSITFTNFSEDYPGGFIRVRDDAAPKGKVGFVWINNRYGSNSAAKVKHVDVAAGDGLGYGTDSELTLTSTRRAATTNHTAFTAATFTDTTRPATTVTSLGANPGGLSVSRDGSGNLVLEGTCIDDGTISWVRVNGVNATSLENNFSRWRVTLTNIGAGSRTITAQAQDSAGNLESTPHTFTITVL